MNRIKNAKTRLLAVILTVLLLLPTAMPALAEAFPAIVTSSRMAVYKDKAMTKPAGALEKYTVVQVTAYEGKAAKISYSGKTGYASIRDMRSLDAIGVKAVTNRADHVYQSPDTGAPSAAVKAGTKIYALSVSGNWALVEKDGVLGYMPVSALTKADDNWTTPDPNATPSPTPGPTPDNSVKATVNVSKLTVYQKASKSSSKLGTLKKGVSVRVVSWDKTWACIELNGRRGYCAVSGLSKAAPTPTPTKIPATPVTVSIKKLPVYKTASAKSPKLGTLKKGTKLNLVSTSGSWACVELNGRIGYCAAKGLDTGTNAPTPTPTPTIAPTATPSTANAARGTVTVKSLDVYRTASASVDKVMTLKKDQLVNVLRWNSEWALIELDGVYGFCSVKGLTRTDASATVMPSATPSTENAIQAEVTQKTLPVHRLAGESSDVIGTLKKTQIVNVLSLSGDWAYIELAGRYGFCLLSGLKLDNKPAIPSDFKKASFTATVIQQQARAYAAPTTTADSVILPLGTSVNVYAYSGEWACVVRGNTYAFIPIKQLSRASYATIEGSGQALLTLNKTLLSYGYYDGIPSATANSISTAAIRRFQSVCDLEVTGVADQTLQRILYGGYAPVCPLITKEVNAKSSMDDIIRLQSRLYSLGYFSKAPSIDGAFGTVTTYAVGLFQKANGLDATGTANVSTMKAIYSTGAVSLPAGAKSAEELAEGGGGSGSVVNPPSSVKLSSTYVTTMPAALKSTTKSYSASMSSAQKKEHVIYSAQEKLGCPYVYGATGPSKFDCSGLSGYAYRQVKVSLKRTAYSQGYDSSYPKISGVSNLKRGDLVFFNTISDSDLCDHVGIYLGGGCFIHASSGGHKVVVSNIASGYYNRVFSWGRRVM